MVPYRAPRWLPDRHSQTLWSALAAVKPRVAYRRERWSTDDGDFIDVDFADGRDASAPMLVLFHGLEGSSDSHYARALCAAAQARGWQAAVPHFRGCSGEPNLLPRAYHSGDSDEIDWIVRRFRARLGEAVPLYLAGVSLGGNAMLKWLGERGSQAGRLVRAAAAVSAPQDLHAGAVSLSAGFSRIYTQAFLRTLKRKCLIKLERDPGLFDRDAMMASRSFFDFDEIVTARLHGFASCFDYWARSSCGQFLPAITTPTLVLSARNDPFVPAATLADGRQLPSCVRLDYPEQGGHVGFVTGPFPGRLDWMPARLMDFFDHG